MGDLRSWSPELNGVVSEKKPSSSSSSSSPSLFLSNHVDIGVDCWRRAENATRGIIDQVQPTIVSEHRRKAVIDYVQRLIRNCVGCEVFPFGSVPLKTYLPDGDIDLTAFGGINVEEALANNVFSVLDSEDKNGAAEFVVKDVKLIHAEVKLVKCLIQNIVVDISFNQLGGLCTLCFLEKVDRLVGKDHLFKRSIILIKAWCYYESRILGAYHGLISTYALETLVLYIFHFFHSTLNGPLEVLFRFLDYYSKFDWDNFCISLNGPVRISLLPEIFAEIPENSREIPENSRDDLLLSNDFLANCVETFSVPAKGCEQNMRAFPLKHLNIFDPLKESNNLGRSVNKGNFSRIRSALAYGASKLGSLLSQSEENVEDEVRTFFWNTLDRHGSGQRPDVQDCGPSSRWSGLGSPVLFSDVELQEDLTSNETEFAYSGVTMGEHRQGRGCDTDVKTTEDENTFGTAIQNEILGTSVLVASSTIFSEVNGLTNGTVISEDLLSPDANKLAISKLEDPAFSESSLQSFLSSVEATSLPFGTGNHAPHPIFSSFSKGDEELKTGISDKKHSERSTEKLELTGYMMKPSEDVSFIANGKQNGNHLVSHQDVRAPAGSKSNSSHVSSTSSDEILEAFSLSDLNGDYDSHLSSLHYGRWCYDYAQTAPVPSICPSLLSHSRSRSGSQKRWNITQHTLQVKGNAFTQMNGNAILSRPAFFPIGPHILPGGTPFGLEEVQKPRGTGTYFPNVNHYKEKTSSSMARNQVPVRSPHKNARVSTPPVINLLEKNHSDLSQSQNHVGVKNGCSDHTSGSPGRKLHQQSKGLIHRDESIVDSGSSGCQQENSRRPNSVSLLSRNLSGSLPLLEVQNSKLVLNVDQDRIAMKSYELKDDGDFPPLSI